MDVVEIAINVKDRVESFIHEVCVEATNGNIQDYYYLKSFIIAGVEKRYLKEAPSEHIKNHTKNSKTSREAILKERI